ncbi:4-(cytidine 5'-diphospho)-2-C-methyl-D-erythritol kinase [soil metagenome]
MFAFCEHGDEIAVKVADTLSLTIDGSFAKGLETDGNLILKAAHILSNERGAAIRLTKNLPVASGVGGGSADAAATLRLLARMWELPLPPVEDQLKLGADVPACVLSETMRGEGVGERLIAASPVTGIPILLVNPRIALSTAQVFRAWDGTDRGPLIDWQSGRNDLEPAARSLVPEIGTILDWLAALPGVDFARMSGSGATCFALFNSVAARDAAAAAVRPDYWWMASILK